MADDSPFRPLDSLADLEDAFEHAEQEPIVFYKHSATCSLSTRAQRDLTELDRPDDPPMYRVIVQDARSVSNAIAERLDIRHESPQAIVVYGDTTLYHASHTRISPDDIRTASTHATHD